MLLKRSFVSGVIKPMRHVLSNLAIVCGAIYIPLVLTGCQSMSHQQKAPCSCGQLHGSVQHQSRNTHIAAAQPATNHVHTVDHSQCTNGYCLHNNGVQVASHQVQHAPLQHALEQTAVANTTHAVCHNCGHTTQVNEVPQTVLIRAQTPKRLASDRLRLGRTHRQSKPVVLRPVPQTSAARVHTVATDQPMVQFSSLNHQMKPIPTTTTTGQWKARNR